MTEPTLVSPQGWAEIALRYESLSRAAGDTHLPKELREMCEFTREALAIAEFAVPTMCVICREDRGHYVATGLEISKWLDRPRGLCARCDDNAMKAIKEGK